MRRWTACAAAFVNLVSRFHVRAFARGLYSCRLRDDFYSEFRTAITARRSRTRWSTGRLGTIRSPARVMGDADKRALWDRKYHEGLPSLTKPDPYFVRAYERFVDRSFPHAGRGLGLAAGLGRHALWLAERRWRVSAVDVSQVALGKLRQSADEIKVDIDLVAIDAADYTFEPAGFDLTCCFTIWTGDFSLKSSPR